jgi:hypothetical protein
MVMFTQTFPTYYCKEPPDRQGIKYFYDDRPNYNRVVGPYPVSNYTYTLDALNLTMM